MPRNGSKIKRSWYSNHLKGFRFCNLQNDIAKNAYIPPTLAGTARRQSLSCQSGRTRRQRAIDRCERTRRADTEGYRAVDAKQLLAEVFSPQHQQNMDPSIP
jgi:hypothetical protein